MGRIWMTGGGGGADLDVITANADDVLIGKVIVDKDGNPLNGRMSYNGAISQELAAGVSYTIPKGYHNGKGVAKAKDLASQTSANALEADIRKNKTAWVNGKKLTGSMTEKAAETYIPQAATQIIAARQYLAGAQTIAGDSNFIASNIKKGVTIFNITGTFEGFVPDASDLYKYGANPANFEFRQYTVSSGSVSCTADFDPDKIRCNSSTSTWGLMNSRNLINFSGYTQLNFEFQNPTPMIAQYRAIIYLMNSSYTGTSETPPNPAYSLTGTDYVTLQPNAIGTYTIPLTNVGNIQKYLTFKCQVSSSPSNKYFIIRRIWLS